MAGKHGADDLISDVIRLRVSYQDISYSTSRIPIKPAMKDSKAASELSLVVSPYDTKTIQ